MLVSSRTASSSPVLTSPAWKFQPIAEMPSNAICLKEIRALPGVISAGEAEMLPLSSGGIDNKVWMEGTDANRKADSNFSWIGAGYLKTMDVTLLAGRDFDEHDVVSSPGVAIVNQSFARRFNLG